MSRRHDPAAPRPADRRARKVPLEIEQALNGCGGKEHAGFRYAARLACAQVLEWQAQRRIMVTVRDEREQAVLCEVERLLEKAMTMPTTARGGKDV